MLRVAEPSTNGDVIRRDDARVGVTYKLMTQCNE